MALQQFREITQAKDAPRFLIHDRDSIYSADPDSAIKSMGFIILKTPVRAPTANAYCERLIGFIRRGLICRIDYSRGALIWIGCGRQNLRGRNPEKTGLGGHWARTTLELMRVGTNVEPFYRINDFGLRRSAKMTQGRQADLTHPKKPMPRTGNLVQFSGNPRSFCSDLNSKGKY
jgi:hypothetical protein